MALARTNQRTSKFDKLYEKLPKRIRPLVDLALAAFLENPDNPILKAHPLKDGGKGRHKTGSTSITVTRRYRAICVVTKTKNLWYWVGSHESYNGFVGSRRK